MLEIVLLINNYLIIYTLIYLHEKIFRFTSEYSKNLDWIKSYHIYKLEPPGGSGLHVEDVDSKVQTVTIRSICLKGLSTNEVGRARYKTMMTWLNATNNQ